MNNDYNSEEIYIPLQGETTQKVMMSTEKWEEIQNQLRCKDERIAELERQIAAGKAFVEPFFRD